MYEVNEVRRIQFNNMVELVLHVNEKFSDWKTVSWKVTTKYTLTLKSSTGLVVVLESSESDEDALRRMFEEEEF